MACKEACQQPRRYVRQSRTCRSLRGGQFRHRQNEPNLHHVFTIGAEPSGAEPSAPKAEYHRRFSRTFDDVGRARPGSVTTPLHQTALSARARSNTNPARPYICRLIVFNRFT